MKVAIIQTHIEDYNIENNIDRVQYLLENIEKDTKWVVLSEMFLTGFVCDVSLAKDSKEKGLSLMREFAHSTGIAIEGSLLVEENGKYFNRHYFISKDNEAFYDKTHLFSFSDEAKTLSAGREKDVITLLEDFKIKMLTCYDLRFPLTSMNTYNDGEFLYDVLVYVASWPSSRKEQWLNLLKARAIENQSYVIATNRIGKDGNGYLYSGDSCVINTKGEILSPIKSFENSIHYYNICKENLNKAREKFPVYKDWDKI